MADKGKKKLTDMEKVNLNTHVVVVKRPYGVFKCIEKIGLYGKPKEYTQMYFSTGYTAISRFVLEHKLGRKIKSNHQACHKCDNPRCINPEHIFEGTLQENLADMMSKGRSARGIKSHLYGQSGEKHPVAKLSNEDADKIRIMYSSGKYTHLELGKIFGISRRTVCSIVNFVCYKVA